MLHATFESMSLEELFAAADAIEANANWSEQSERPWEVDDISIEDCGSCGAEAWDC